MPHELINAWASFRPGVGPHVLPGDEVLLDPSESRFVIHHRSWRALLGSPDFGNQDRRLHLSLIPQPFFGNIDSAPVVILSLNPGLKPIDYFGEQFVKPYRRALVANLRLKLRNSRFPHLFLNPAFSWHSGFTYWHGRFSPLIDAFSRDAGTCRIEAMSFFSKSIATLELVPYHSASFGLPKHVVSRLRSVKLAREFVQDILLPRARASETLIVVVRQSPRWECKKEDSGVIVYQGAETRAAYLGPGSRGGDAILERLRQIWRDSA